MFFLFLILVVFEKIIVFTGVKHISINKIYF